MKALDFKPLRLLVIDDEPLQLNSLCDLLERAGYLVNGYTDPLAALGDPQLQQYDLLLVDLVMPAMNGLEVMQALQSIVPHLGCLVVTAEASIAGSVEAMQAGALDFIPKPFDLSTLLPALTRAHRLQQLHRGQRDAESAGRDTQAALEEANRRLVLANAEAVRANQAKSAFVARLSHELRTPLNAILGFSHILQSSTLPTTQLQRTEFAQHIQQAAKHVLAMMNDLLDLAQIEAGKLALAPVTLPMRAALDECCALLTPIANAHAVSLHVSAEAPLLVVADPLRLRQILLNLLTNAIKYNRRGGQVRINLQLRPNAQVCLAVQDDGAGMTTAQIDRLFQPFERLGRRDDAGGWGLGLAIAQQLARSMHGSITVESQVGAGSTFTLLLPAVLAEAI
jgi:signal transduction histidine kinase